MNLPTISYAIKRKRNEGIYKMECISNYSKNLEEMLEGLNMTRGTEKRSPVLIDIGYENELDLK